ncbi:hypothetical protein ES703_18056 [subsurface metagenome]
MVVSLKPLAIGADIVVKYGSLQLRVMLLSQDHVFHGIHAAHRRTIALFHSGIPGTDALDPGYPLGRLFVGRTLHLSPVGTGGAQYPLEFEAGDHIAHSAIAVFGLESRIEGLIARGQDYGPNLNLHFLFLLIEVNSLILAHGGTDFALPFAGEEAELSVYYRHCGYRLGEGNTDTFDNGQALIIGIEHLYRAVLGTGPAADTQVLLHISRLLEQGHVEIARLPLDLLDIVIGQDRYVQVPGTLDEFGGQNAHGTIIGGEGLVQLGHPATDGWVLVHQIDLEAGIGQVQGSLYATDPSTHYHNRAHLALSGGRCLNLILRCHSDFPRYFNEPFNVSYIAS